MTPTLTGTRGAIGLSVQNTVLVVKGSTLRGKLSPKFRELVKIVFGFSDTDHMIALLRIDLRSLVGAHVRLNIPVLR